MSYMSRKQGNSSLRRKEKRALKYQGIEYVPENYIRVPDVKVKPIRPLNEVQATYLHSIEDNIITFGIGSAGTGKTYISGSYAADQLRENPNCKLIICRPGVTAGEDYGFLPGTLDDKFSPFLDPYLDVLEERLGKSFVASLRGSGRILAKPLAFLRGKSFKDAIIVLTEAQNANVEQMELFLTRVGEGCKVIVDGDIRQADIRNSGLMDAVNRLYKITSIGVVQFQIEDCVRSGICKQILLAYQ
jgi:phosphate starvation-inducible PhoH-like protein